MCCGFLQAENIALLSDRLHMWRLHVGLFLDTVTGLNESLELGRTLPVRGGRPVLQDVVAVAVAAAADGTEIAL